MGVLKKLGWDEDLTPEELAVISSIGGNNVDAVNWATDLSGGIQRVCLEHGCIPSATPRRARWPGTCPTRCRCTASRSTRRGRTWWRSTRPCRTQRQFRHAEHRLLGAEGAVEKNVAKDFPIILTSGRLVEYEGGGEETRSNPWLAELQQDMFVEINPEDADRARHQGRRNGSGCTAPRTAPRPRSRRWSPSGSARASPSCRSTSRRLVPGRGHARPSIRRAPTRSCSARRQHRHDLRLRPGDHHAGNQDHAVPDRARRKEETRPWHE